MSGRILLALSIGSLALLACQRAEKPADAAEKASASGVGEPVVVGQGYFACLPVVSMRPRLREQGVSEEQLDIFAADACDAEEPSVCFTLAGDGLAWRIRDSYCAFTHDLVQRYGEAFLRALERDFGASLAAPKVLASYVAAMRWSLEQPTTTAGYLYLRPPPFDLVDKPPLGNPEADALPWTLQEIAEEGLGQLAEPSSKPCDSGGGLQGTYLLPRDPAPGVDAAVSEHTVDLANLIKPGSVVRYGGKSAALQAVVVRWLDQAAKTSAQLHESNREKRVEETKVLAKVAVFVFVLIGKIIAGLFSPSPAFAAALDDAPGQLVELGQGMVSLAQAESLVNELRKVGDA